MDLITAEKLARLRKEYGYSQEELADLLGVSRQAVSKWERAESSPDTDNLIALAALYGVTLDELLHYDAAARRKAEQNRREDAETERDTRSGKDFFAVRSDKGEVVRIGRDGLKVDDGKGNRVESRRLRSTSSAPPNGGTTINVNGVPYQKGDYVCFNGKEWGRGKLSLRVNAIRNTLNGLFFFATLAAFLVWGFLGGWRVSWLVWFLLPTMTSLIDAIAYRNAQRFAFPVLIAGVYLAMGMFWSLWHPGWAIFFSIPFYYFIVSFIKEASK